MKLLHRIQTADGSLTLRRTDLGETYHSNQGAITESMHIYIRSGLLHVLPKSDELVIAEVGFGTGLNALLTALERPEQVAIRYYGIDNMPLAANDMLAMEYPSLLKRKDAADLYHMIAAVPWQDNISPITAKAQPGFQLSKLAGAVQLLRIPEAADLVYYDAFAPKYQPELWEQPIFELLAQQMKAGGVLVTYCARGKFRRMLEALGWTVERLEGPAGFKKEMIRATCPG